MVLWLKEDKTYNESRSLDPLSNNPRLAKLVRSGQISVASFEYDDIKRSIQGFARSTDEALRWLVRGVCDILGFDQPKLDFDREDDQVGINIGDLTHEELLAMDEYCRVYLEEPTHGKEFGYPDLTHLQEEMGKDLTLFPNLQHTLLWRPTLEQTPLFAEMVGFWVKHGFAYPYSTVFVNLLFGSDRLLTWNPQTITAGVEVIPRHIRKAGLSIAPFEDLAPGDDDKPHLVDILHIPEEAYQQFRMLHLDIDPFYNMHRAYKCLPPIFQ
jgi:hypothetical protein